MSFPRESGVLLHPTSLPGPHGVGDFGDAAFRFVDWLASAGQRLWQVMPLGPTGFGDSPYSSPSAFAGNPLLVSLPWLVGDGLLDDSDLTDVPSFPDDHVEFGAVSDFKQGRLQLAFERFTQGRGSELADELKDFAVSEAWWLEDYSQFMAIKQANELRNWQSWDRPLRLRDPEAMAAIAQDYADELAYVRFVQFLFNRQWMAVRRYANERGVRIIGDIPIFVAEDSADVWANQAQFKVDADGRAQAVAGVPPDPFSATGQIWGNPLYDWATMRSDQFDWWRKRIRRTLATVDVVRIDHFRGFAAAWTVPAGSASAAVGHWERSPGAEVFAAIRREFGDIQIIIEDLGVITPDVVTLRELLGFPGMNVLQFAFENDPENVYLPHNYRRDSVVYTATHDNQTTVGWFRSRSGAEREAIQRYLGRDGSDIAWDLIRVALSSVANTVIIAAQDILRLDDSARMNVPGQAEGNWSWRVVENQLTEELAGGLRDLSWMYGRDAASPVQRGQNPWDYTTPGTSHPAVGP